MGRYEGKSIIQSPSSPQTLSEGLFPLWGHSENLLAPRSVDATRSSPTLLR